MFDSRGLYARLAVASLFIVLCSIAWPAYAIDMKVDRVTINTAIGTSGWQAVTFQQAFSQVPVVITTPTDSNADPASVRIRNVTTTGFEVMLAESQGSDGATSAMSISYFAAEPGTYTFPGSVRLDVFLYATQTQQGRNIASTGWDTVAFSANFSSAPAVVTQIQSANSTPALTVGDVSSPFLEVAVRNVNSNTMQMAIERGETSTTPIATEVIGYIAMESGDQFSLGGATVQALLTADNIQGWSNGCYTTNFASAFASAPLAVAGQNSRDGGDGGWARQCSLSSSAIGLTIDEDVAADSDRSHTTEEVGIIAASQAFHGTRNGRRIEAGSAVIPSSSNPTQWTSVSFPNPFSQTPRVFSLATSQGAGPAALRVRNVTTTGFDIAAFAPTGSAAPPPQMEVDYVAIIPGDHTMPGGEIFEVGSIDTSVYQAGTGGSTGTVDINFNASFGGAPAVLLQIQSINNEPGMDPNAVSEPWMVTAVNSLTASRIRVALDRAEAINGSISSAETLAYFAMSDGANESLVATDNASVDYEAFISPDNILGHDDGCYNNAFSESYASPYAIATQSSRDGNNGGWLRRCALSSSAIGLFVDEDQANDSERTHTTEEASIFVFSRAFEAEINAIDHYAIFHSGTGVTCEAETVTIAAHDASDLGVDAAARTITVSATSSTPGWLPSDVSWALAAGYTGAFSSTNAQATYTFGTGESAVELLLSNTSEADIDIDVVDGDPSITDIEGSAEDPIMSFVDTALRFYNDANGDGDADGNDPIEDSIVAGTPSGQWILRAVQTNNGTGACEARASGPLSVNLGYECIDPNTCVRNDDAEINNVAIADNDFGAATNYNSVTLTFDADGEAPISLEYFDVGEIELHVQLNLPADGSNPAVTLEGTSGLTISRPAALVITSIEDAGGGANPGTSTSGSGFVASEEAFTIIAQARNAVGGLTPNFGNEAIAEGISAEAVSLVMPATGDLPPLSNANAFSATATAGEFSNIALEFREAGTIQLRVRLSDGNYMGTGFDIVGATSGDVGRFYAEELNLVSQSIANGCASGFTYMSDIALTYTPIDLNLTVEAHSARGNVLDNYDGNYPTATLGYASENNDSGSNIAARWGLPSATWVDGIYEITGIDNAGFSRNDVGGLEQADGPFSAIDLGVYVLSSTDSEDFPSADFDMNATTTGDCSLSADCDAITLGSIAAYFGRLALGNANGPATAPLDVLFETQVWDTAANEFLTHTADSCTTIAMADIQFDSSTLSIDANRTVSVGGGTSTGSFDSFIAGGDLSFTNGDAGLNFSGPGAGNNGSFYVDVDLSNTPWLQSDWNQNGDAADDSALPSGEITFGSYRGHDRVHYWREVLK